MIIDTNSERARVLRLRASKARARAKLITVSMWEPESMEGKAIWHQTKQLAESLEDLADGLAWVLE